MTFVENEILPRMDEDPAIFYVEDGSRQPEFEASMDRLRDWRFEAQQNLEWALCLDERLNAPAAAGKSCAPNQDLRGSGPAASAGRKKR